MSLPRALNILVTGGSGFVGRALLERLLARGHSVVATTRTPGKPLPGAANLRWVAWSPPQPLPDVEWSRFQVIVHLAAPTRATDFPACAREHFDVSVAATFALLEQARRAGVSRLILASSGEVLGAAPPRPADEGDECYRPGSFYGSAKACAELLVGSYQSVLSTAVLRFFHPYGPGGDHFLVNRLLAKVRAGQEVTCEGAEGILLNPVWIEDLAAGIQWAVESTATGVFHLAGPNLVTLRALLDLMGRVVGRAPVVRVVPAKDGPAHAGTCDRARQALGFHPTTDLPTGLRRLLEADGEPAGPWPGSREGSSEPCLS